MSEAAPFGKSPVDFKHHATDFIANEISQYLTTMISTRLTTITLLLALPVALCGGCSPLMHNQARYEDLEYSPLLENGWTRKAPVEAVPRRNNEGRLYRDDSGNISQTVVTWHVNDPLEFGRTADGDPLEEIPMPLTMQLLERGQQRYNIYCSVCHDRVGTGRGMVVQRGFPAPPSLHLERIREASPGQIFAVISNGFKAMPAYRDKLNPHDRWAVVAYVKALQLSQHTVLADAPADVQEHFESP